MRKERNAFARTRIEKGFTQQSLAAQCGITPKTIQIWETKGTKHARVATLMDAAEALGVGIQEIIC